MDPSVNESSSPVDSTNSPNANPSPERAFWERNGDRFGLGPDQSADTKDAETQPGQGVEFLGQVRDRLNSWAADLENWTSRRDSRNSVVDDAMRRASLRDGGDGVLGLVNGTASRGAHGAGALWEQLRNLPGIRTWKVLNDMLFLATSFVVGLFWGIFALVMLVTGAALIVVWIGVPILAITLGLMIWAAQLERMRIRAFTGAAIPEPNNYVPKSGGFWKRVRGFFQNRQLWRDISYLMILMPLGILELFIASLPIFLLLMPTIGIFSGGGVEMLGWHLSNSAESMLALIVGFVFLVPACMLVNFAVLMHVRLGQWLLAPTTQEVLTERVEELTESRSAVMRAMYMERRRIERDLHDGAQQRLVNLAMELGRAREKMENDPDGARQLVEESHQEAKQVLTDLRELVRGIHPVVLTDRGLDAAISAIAGRSPIPVGVDVNLGERQADEVEGTAYFVVVEALTNIARHSHATEANVSIRRDRDWLRIVVSDNGTGGADASRGTGLRGLQDRIAALDGRFAVESPEGVGTSILVEIPCA